VIEVPIESISYILKWTWEEGSVLEKDHPPRMVEIHEESNIFGNVVVRDPRTKEYLWSASFDRIFKSLNSSHWKKKVLIEFL
jgi:hypothetical protein